MKTCRICKQPKPISEFGHNTLYETTGERDGLSIYCRNCNRDRVKNARRIAQRIRRERQRHPVTGLPVDQVLGAVRKGKRTRDEIRNSTQLTMDETVDALAELALVTREIYSKRIDGDAHFFLKAA
jgi:hypothetical protein